MKTSPLTASLARGTSRVPAFMLALVACFSLSLSASSCHPPTPAPSADGSVVSTPSGWTDTARTVLDVLAWILPGARAVLNNLLSEPGRTQVGRVLTTTADYASRLRVAVDAYEARGGDRCAAQAAVAGVRASLIELAVVLADNGLALGVPLGRVVDSAAAIVDELMPGCVAQGAQGLDAGADAAWLSAGAQSNAALRSIERGAVGRGVFLRRDLGNLSPPAQSSQSATAH